MMSSASPTRITLAFLGGALAFALLVLLSPDTAQWAHAQGKVADPIVQVPSFWDPRRRPERLDLSCLITNPFPTETDYPPFNFAGPDGNPQGFNVDLARIMCEELKIPCTVQMRRFETLVAALNENRGDAVIASMAATPDVRSKVDFTDPYYRTPARFVVRRDSAIEDPLPEKLEGRKVAVTAGTAHEAYLRALFTEVEVRPYPNADVARLALRRGDVELLFGDAISLAFWLNGALFRVWEQGRFTDLWLRYFPISPF